MNNELFTLNQIFNDRIFRIPDYQRGYAWGEPQLKAFWEDLVTLDTERKHYTGLISIQSVPESKWRNWNEEQWLIKQGNKPFFVVDGQQRLTTISIFMQALFETNTRLAEAGDPNVDTKYLGGYAIKEKLIEKFIKIDEPRHGIYTAYKFGYEIDNPSFSFLRYKIFNQSNPPQLKETLYTLNLERAKKFFMKNLENLYASKGVKSLEDIFEALTQRFLFNLYELHDDFDVCVAFETMNNRGKPLSHLELLKNRLIYLTTLYPSSVVDDASKAVARSSINEAWSEVYNQLGRNKLAPLSDDEFLRAHWIMYFKYSRKRGDDYIDFLLNSYFSPKAILGEIDISLDGLPVVVERTEAVDTDDDEIVADEAEELQYVNEHRTLKDVIDYTESIKSAAPVWYATYYPNDSLELLNSDEVIAMDRLNRLGMAYFRPLVMSVMLRYSKEDSRRLAFLNAVERFVFVAMRMYRAQANYRSSDFLRAARSIFWRKLDLDQVLDAFNSKQEWLFESDGVTVKSTDFFSFIRRKFESGGKGFYGWNDLRYFLYEYEEGLKNGLGQQKQNGRGQQKFGWSNFVRHEKDRVSIEHIYPQTATDDYWQIRFSGLSDIQIRQLQGSLGNLLPLSSSINSSLQNVSFPEKKSSGGGRNGYSNGSYSELEVAQYLDWTPNDILERGIKLLRFMETRWNIRLGDREDLVALLHLAFLDEKPTVADQQNALQ